MSWILTTYKSRFVSEVFWTSWIWDCKCFRAHLPRFLLAFACGAVPLQILNHFWLRDLAAVNFREGEITATETWQLIGFILCVAQMVFIESQLAGIVATKYLGLVLFQEEPRILPVLRQVGRTGWRLLWCQGLTRGVIVAGVLAAWSRSSNWSFIWLGSLTCLIVLMRALRPFLNEIVLLENNPLLATKAHSLTIGRRSYRLHAPSSGMLIGRWFCSALIGVALSISVAGLFLFVSGVMFQQWFPRPIRDSNRRSFGNVDCRRLLDGGAFPELLGFAHTRRRLGGGVTHAG